MRAEVQALEALLNEAFQGPAWHGASLKGTLRGVSAEEALWKPYPDRHSIWELMLHCAYWKHLVCSHVDADAAGRFGRTGSNFPKLPEKPTEAAWRADQAFLADRHAVLLDALRGLKDADLDRPATRGNTLRTEVRGIALHDVHHGGQIKLLRALWEG